MTRRWRGAFAVALLALGSLLQGCAGIAVPGCTRKEIHVVESGHLVAASRKEHVTYGFFCSPLLLFRLHEGVLPCWWEWG